MFCAVVIEEAAAPFTVTRPQPAICGRQGPRIVASICWVYLHLFKEFGMETLCFPTLCCGRGQKGALLVRAGQTPGPGLPVMPQLATWRVPGTETIQDSRLSKDMLGKAGPTGIGNGMALLCARDFRQFVLSGHL